MPAFMNIWRIIDRDLSWIMPQTLTLYEAPNFKLCVMLLDLLG